MKPCSHHAAAEPDQRRAGSRAPGRPRGCADRAAGRRPKPAPSPAPRSRRNGRGKAPTGRWPAGRASRSDGEVGNTRNSLFGRYRPVSRSYNISCAKSSVSRWTVFYATHARRCARTPVSAAIFQRRRSGIRRRRVTGNCPRRRARSAPLGKLPRLRHRRAPCSPAPSEPSPAPRRDRRLADCSSRSWSS